MKETTMRLPAFALAAVFCAATTAEAHVALQQTEARAGGYYVAAFQVGHGCAAGLATTALSVTLPEGVDEAKPQPKPGWTFERAGGVVTWTGRVEDSQFEVFPLLVKLPAKAGPLYFPTVQTCGGAAQRWVEIPAPGAAWTSVPHPAPVVTLSGGAAAAAADPTAGHQH